MKKFIGLAFILALSACSTTPNGGFVGAEGDISGRTRNLNDLRDVNAGSPSDNHALTWDAGTSRWINEALAGTGDVVGPSSSVDNEIPRWDLATGKLLQGGGGASISDVGLMYTTNLTTLAGAYPTADGASGEVLTTNGAGTFSFSAAGSGDFSGPASSTDETLVRFDGAGGKTGQASLVSVADDGATVIQSDDATTVDEDILTLKDDQGTVGTANDFKNIIWESENDAASRYVGAYIRYVLIDPADTEMDAELRFGIMVAGSEAERLRLDVLGVDVTGAFTVSGTSTLTGDVTLTGDIDIDGGDITAPVDLTISPTGLDVLLNSGLTVGSTTQAGDNNLRVEGTSALVGDVTLTGDIAINGDDITTDGDLTVTPSGGDFIVAGTSQGLTLVTSDTLATITLTEADCRNSLRLNGDNDVIDYTLPAAPTTGATVTIRQQTGSTAVITVDCGNGTDVIVLNDGTALAAGNATDSPGTAGDAATFVYDGANWHMIGIVNTWVDGGAD